MGEWALPFSLITKYEVVFGVLVVGSFLVRCCVVVSSFWVGVSIPRSLLEEEVCWAVWRVHCSLKRKKGEGGILAFLTV